MASMDWFNLSLDKKSAYLKDKRLTEAERTILECSILLRENKYEQIVNLLTKLSVQNSFVDSQRYLVLGVAYNVSGNCLKAVDCFLQAIEILSEQDLPDYEFNACLQLFFTHLNLKQKQEMEEVLDKMGDILNANIFNRISFLRCQFNYYLFVEDYIRAKSFHNKLRELVSQMRPGQRIYFLIDEFTFFLKTDRYSKCQDTLEELKRFRTYKTSENFVFMQAMLAHYQYKKPIYIDDNQFSKTPLLFFQIQVIKSLESGNLTNAKKFWAELNAINNNVYKEFMNYNGDKCLFSICLGLYQSNSQKDVSRFLAKLSPIEQKLILLLAESTLPLSKEEIFLHLYGKAYETKDDLKKLSLICTKIKYKTGLLIKSSKGSYRLVMEDEMNVA